MGKRRKSPRRRLIHSLDRFISLIVRNRQVCERCGKHGFLQASHVIPKRFLQLRWDETNILCLCGYCHKFFWHENPVEAYLWLEHYKGKDYITDLLNRKGTKIPHYEEKFLKELMDILSKRVKSLKLL